MLYYALSFLVLAVIAGLFGFGLIASAAVGIAKVLFFLFLILFATSALAGMLRRGAPS